MVAAAITSLPYFQYIIEWYCVGASARGSSEEQVAQLRSKYEAFIRPSDEPAIEMNAEIMEEHREEMRRYYYDSENHDSYLDQLGVSYPTLRQPDGSCRIGSMSEQGAGGD